MKTIANLIVVASMFISQFSVPYTSRALEQNDTPTVTATQPPDAPTSETPTVPPTESTPVPSETATLTPTSTEIPPLETVPPVEPIIAINLNTTPSFVTPGGQIKIDWRVDGIELKEHELFLNIILPTGFIPFEKDGSFDENTRTLSIPVLKDSGKFKLQADEFTEDATLLASLLENETILTQSSLILATKDQFNVDAKGGEIQSSDGKIKLNFPADTFSTDTVIQIGKSGRNDFSSYSLSGRPFSMNAIDGKSGEDIHQFDKEIEIKVSYADLGFPSDMAENIFLYWYNPEIKEWEALPSAVDRENQTVNGMTTHFSLFDVGLNQWQASHVPTVDAFQVSTYTGAGTFSLPIEVPAGPGGLQPNLALSYNSQVVDQSTTVTQASWVGMGWTLETGSIEADTNNTTNTNDDTYFLNVAGVSTRLIKNGNEFSAADENFWKFTYDTTADTWTVWDKQGNVYLFGLVNRLAYQITDCDPGPNGGGEGGAFISYKWSLTQVKNIFNKTLEYTYRKETKDIPIPSYRELEEDCWSNDYTTDTAVFPETIVYPNERYRVYFDTTTRSDFPFSWQTDAVHHGFERSLLKNIYIQHDGSGNGFVDPTTDSTQTVRRYEFTYETDLAKTIFPGYTYSAGSQISTPDSASGKASTLIKVQEFGVGGTTSLPAHTFTYGDYLHLTKAENGYGGVVEYDYDSEPSQILHQPWVYEGGTIEAYNIFHTFGDAYYGWVPCDGGSTVESGDYDWLIHGCAVINMQDQLRPGGAYRLTASFHDLSPNLSVKIGIDNQFPDSFSNFYNTPATIVKNYTLPVNSNKAQFLVVTSGGGSEGHASLRDYRFELLPSFYRVMQKRVYSSSTAAPYNYNYTYQDPAINQTTNYYVEPYSEFRGHGIVTETGPDGGKTIYQYHQDDVKKGRMEQVTTMVANDKIQESIYNYDVSMLAGVGHYWIRPTSTESLKYAANNALFARTRTTYIYPENFYGNLTGQADETWNGTSWVTYRRTTTDYFPNNTSTRYLVSLPAKTKVFDGNNNDLGVTTVYLYDGNTGSYAVAPVDGKLTAIRTHMYGVNYNQVSYSYDNTWGNRISETTYSSFGAWDSSPSLLDARTTTTLYDDTYHTYPISITTPPTQNAPLGLKTTLSYDFKIGKPLTESDPNDPDTTLTTEAGNTTIEAQYDAFGRMTKLIRPGNDSNNPTLKMEYSNSYPFTTSITQRVDSNNTYTVTRLYDGIGRLTTSIGYPGVPVPFTVMSGPNYVYTDTQYVSATITKQSMPHISTETAQYTTTTIDLNARTVTVAAPDGTRTVTTANGLATTARDVRENITNTTVDVWGRTVSVVPPTGPAVRYVYDPLGNMTYAIRGPQASVNNPSCYNATPPTTALCPTSTITTITYEPSGLKATMSDPDMGAWSYSYNALGNLTQQVDAKGQYTCMYYDNINRLKGKNYLTSSCPEADPNTYTMTNSYDAGTNGVGRRTGMTNTSNGLTTTNSWTYDTRGRVASETVMGYTTSYSYNHADLLATMTYPGVGGETVAYDYNAQMLLEKLRDTKNTSGTSDDYYYVNASSFDVAGRLTDRTLGNGVAQKFIYPAWTSQGGRLDKIIAGSGAWNASTQTFATTLQKLDYAYDQSGNITQISNPIAVTTPAPVTETQSFTYDSLDRLTSAQASGVAAGAYSETYTYNPLTGNLASKGNAVPALNPGESGLVAWWDLNETSGQRNDSKGTNHLADTKNTISFAATNQGNAASFATADLEYLYLIDNPAISGGDIDFTLTGNVYLNTTSSIMVIANKGMPNSNNRDYVLFFDSSNQKFTFKVGNGSVSGSVSSNQTISAGQWYTVFAWHDSVADTLNIQVNNEIPNSTDYTNGSIDTAYPLSIGAHSDGVGGVNGLLDEFSFYRRVLSSSERTWLYNYGMGRSYIDVSLPSGDPGKTNLSAWWTMNEDNGQRNDSIGSNHLGQTGIVASAVGRKGAAASFNSTAPSVLNYIDNPQISTGDVDFTLTASFYPYDINGTKVLINKGLKGSPSIQDYALLQYGATLGFRVGNGTTSTTVTSASFTANTWHTVVAWHDSVNNTINIQIDNGAINSEFHDGGAMDTAYSLSIGGHLDSTSIFNGRIDEVALYKRVLNANHRKWLHNSGNGRAYSELNSELILPNYTYDPAPAHAVTSLTNGNSYTYDANGNMETRDIASGAEAGDYTLSYDAENRMTQVNRNSVVLQKFFYDGDGKRVKSETYNSSGALTETILFIGAHYEVSTVGTTTTYTKYYFAGATRVAMRKYTIPKFSTLTYLLGDHLGSTSLAVDASTGVVTETRYKAWGEVRYTTSNKTLPTRNNFTGQYSYVADDATDLGNSGFGLMFYQSRFYDPALGRFAQADSIVPSGVQGMDRYAYVNNSPLVYVDPSGHMCSDPDDESSSGCDGNGSQPSNTNTLPLASNKTDPVGSLSAWGIKIKEMYQAWARQCNGWESDCTSYSTENFMVLILSFEFRTLNLDKNTHEAEDLAHAANHWFYMTCDYRTGPASGDCQGVSDNAIFNWVGAMESARRRYNAWKANISWQIDATGNIDLAKYVVDMIYTPLSIEWHRSSGNSWNGANDPVNRHPYAWANGYLFVHLPRDFIWAYPFGVKPDGDSAYLLTLLQTDSTPKR